MVFLSRRSEDQEAPRVFEQGKVLIESRDDPVFAVVLACCRKRRSLLIIPVDPVIPKIAGTVSAQRQHQRRRRIKATRKPRSRFAGVPALLRDDNLHDWAISLRKSNNTCQKPARYIILKMGAFGRITTECTGDFDLLQGPSSAIMMRKRLFFLESTMLSNK